MTHFKHIAKGILAAVPNALVLYPTALVLGSLAGTGAWPSLIATFIGTTLLSLVNQHPNLVHAPATSMCIAGAAVSAQFGLSTACVAAALTGIMQFLLGRFGRSWIFYVIPKHLTNVIISAVGVSLIIHQWNAFHKASAATTRHLYSASYMNNFAFLVVGIIAIAVLQKSKAIKNYAYVVVPAIGAIAAYTFRLDLVPWQKQSTFDSDMLFFNFIQWNEVHWYGAVISSFSLLFICSMKEAVVMSRMEEEAPSEEKPDVNKQFRWLGLANLTCGVFALPPLAVITDRSMQSLRNAPNNRASVFFQGVFVLAMGIFAPHLFEHVPLACITILLLYSGFRLIDWTEVRNLPRMSKPDAALVVIVFTTVLLFDIPAGTIVALVIALVHLGFSFASDCEIYLVEESPEQCSIKIKGAMTFLSIPRLKDIYEDIGKRKWTIDTRELFFIDYASRCYIEELLESPNASIDVDQKQSALNNLSLNRPSRYREQVLDEIRALDRRSAERQNLGRRKMDQYLSKDPNAPSDRSKGPKAG